MEIRKATRADAQAAWDIRNAAINGQCAGYYCAQELATWTAGELTDGFVNAVADAGHVATVEGVAIATGMIALASGQLDAIFVAPAHARTGVGRQMLQRLERLAIEAGFARLRLDATLNAAPFYRAQGHVGDVVAKFDSPRGISLACIPMVKELGKPRT